MLTIKKLKSQKPKKKKKKKKNPVPLLANLDLSHFHNENDLELLCLSLLYTLKNLLPARSQHSILAKFFSQYMPWHLNISENICVLSSRFFPELLLRIGKKIRNPNLFLASEKLTK